MLADPLSIPTGDRYPPLNLTPQKRKEKTFHAQLAQRGLAACQPVLMVWEDGHWSDPTTREVLDLLTEIDRKAEIGRVRSRRSGRQREDPAYLVQLDGGRILTRPLGCAGNRHRT